MIRQFLIQTIGFIQRHKESILIGLVLLAAIIPFGINMLHYPYLENDEGTYMAQAWAVSTRGELSHYTYWYDHAPVGWLLISIWTYFTGGFFTFGIAENSGRVLMLVLHVAIALMVYGIGKRLTKSSLAAAMAAMIFCFSPLGIYFERRILLDNIMTFWLMISLYCIIKEQLKLRHVVISAVTFALAVLTKENAMFALPGLLYGVIAQTSHRIRRFAVSVWIVIVGSIGSLYVLYALIKNEFFPAQNAEHVSLIETLKFQASRGNGLPFWQTGSDFYQNFSEWVLHDPYTVYVGLFAILISIVLSVKHKTLRILTLVTLGSLLFILRGGLVINFYIIPFIPLFALHIAYMVYLLFMKITRIRLAQATLQGIATGAIILVLTGLPSYSVLHSANDTAAQVESIHWIKDNLPEESEIIIDGYAYTDLQAPYYNGKQFPNADWFSKVTQDPEVRVDKLKNDWRNVDYIMLSHEMGRQLRYSDHAFVSEVLAHSVPIKVFSKTITAEAWERPHDFVFEHPDAVIILKVTTERD